MTRLASYLTKAGFAAIFLAWLILYLTFYPVVTHELQYHLKKLLRSEPITNFAPDVVAEKVTVPVDEEFGIIIPKIDANSKVITNVDPYNSREYQVALTKGVAHAKGSVLPNESGNVFIFSHSSANFYDAARYNSVFYLLNKMEKGDEIYIFYKKEKIKYLVTDKKIVDPTAVNYLTGDKRKKTLTLMTCWPPGTTLKRLLIIAEQV